MVVLTMLAPLTTSAWVLVNETNFPDANFRNFVKQKYGSYSSSNPQITDATLESVEEMDCSGKNIENLKGIEFFTNLKTLNCSNNKLISLSVASNTELTELDCQNNQLRALYIGPNLSKLVSVFCYDNQMNYSAVRRLASTLPSFSNGGFHGIVLYNPTSSSEKNCIVANSRFNTGWRVLCYESQTTVQPVSYEVSDEPAPLLISTAYFQDTKLLNIMKTYDINKDGSLSADELHQVTSLNVGGKGLTTLKGIEYLTNLQYLFADNNDLTSLDVSKNPFLNYLTCQQNRIFDTEMDNLITSLPPLLAKLCYSVPVESSDSNTGLAVGQFFCHKATNSSPWEGNAITAQQVQKSNNKNWTPFIYSGGEWSVTATEGQLHINQKSFPDTYFRNLIKNGCSTNIPKAFNTNGDGYLSKAERDAVTLIYLDEDFDDCNNVKSIQGIEYFPQVTEIYFRYWSELQNSVDLSRNTKLTIFDTNMTKISAITFPKSIKNIDFASEKIGTLSLPTQTELKALTLTAPNLQSLNINRCYDLVDLFVSGCPNLLQFGITNNTKLERLNISGCNNIQNKATLIQNIENLTKLTSLKCSNVSFLSSSGQLKLTKATELQDLYCDHCQILDLDLSNNTKLRTVDCSYNPMQWLTMPTSFPYLKRLDIQGCWLMNDQISDIVWALPQAGENDTRVITLYDSDMSEHNEVTPFDIAVASRAEMNNWTCQFISHSGSSTTRKDYNFDYNHIMPELLPDGSMSHVGTQLPISILSNQAILSFEFDLILPRYFTLMEYDNEFLVISENENQVPTANIKVEFTGTVPNTDAKIYHIKANVKNPQRGVVFDGGNVMKLWVVSTVGSVNAENWMARVINGKMRPAASLDDIYTGPVCHYLELDWLGDVNGDKKVTPADAIMMLYNYFGVDQTDFNIKLADVNRDGNYSPADAIQALYMYFGDDLNNLSRQKKDVKNVDDVEPE